MTARWLHVVVALVALLVAGATPSAAEDGETTVPEKDTQPVDQKTTEEGESNTNLGFVDDLGLPDKDVKKFDEYVTETARLLGSGGAGGPSPVGPLCFAGDKSPSCDTSMMVAGEGATPGPLTAAGARLCDPNVTRGTARVCQMAGDKVSSDCMTVRMSRASPSSTVAEGCIGPALLPICRPAPVPTDCRIRVGPYGPCRLGLDHKGRPVCASPQ